MTTPATTPAASVFTPPANNYFELSDRDSETKVTLRLGPSGPPRPDVNWQGPSLEYDGAEGTLSFSGDEIKTDTTSLGQMFTVTLNVVPDSRVLSFTLMLPSVVHKSGVRSQPFHTFAVKSERHTSLQGTPTTPGANPSYTVLKMHGTAAEVMIPL